jgi:ureidoacrylate peracid hydrolase
VNGACCSCRRHAIVGLRREDKDVGEAMNSPEKPILVNARPEPISIDPQRTAVIVIDMQNDFGSDGGMFALAGIDISTIKAVVPVIAKLLGTARRAGIAIIYLKMGHLPDLSDAGTANSAHFQRHKRMRVGEAVRAPDGSGSRILIRDTWNTEILPELTPQPGDVTLYKHRYSGFFQTRLDDILKERGIETLLFTGCTTSVCVESTMRDAMFRDYTCLLLEDCTAEPIGQHLPRGNHDASLLVLQILFGWVGRSGDLIKALERERTVAHA